MTPPGRPAEAAPPGGPALRVQDFRLLCQHINEQCGLSFEQDAAHVLARRLAPRVQHHGLADFAAYCRLLRDEAARGAELEAVVDALTPHETYLFREPHQFRAFSDQILPALAAGNSRQRRIRIWSAGCATGEEVYTIAVLLARSGLFTGWDVEVLGSDIVRRVLATARAGVYGPRAFRTPEAELLRPWFRERDGGWQVVDQVREMTRFAHLNLVDPRSAAKVARVDVVFCRNVLIYFDLASRRRVLRTFHDKLRDGGFLLLGHSESLRNVSADFEQVHLREDVAYRKPPPAS